jgi:hypothetical protein
MRLTTLTTRKMTKAMMRKSTMAWMSLPIPSMTAGLSPTAGLSTHPNCEKSTPPSTSPIGGMSTSPTSEETIFPNAAPMTTPTARSRTLPRITKALNSRAMPVMDPSFRLRERLE